MKQISAVEDELVLLLDVVLCPKDNFRMITDPLFYRLFKSNPETFFLVLGMDVASAKEAAAKYEYEAIEFKETSHRVDGVFRPKEPGLP